MEYVITITIDPPHTEIYRYSYTEGYYLYPSRGFMNQVGRIILLLTF